MWAPWSATKFPGGHDLYGRRGLVEGCPGKNTFLGYWKTPEGWLSDVAEIRLGGLREGPLHIELAGAKFAPGADETLAISNLPDGPGEHVVALRRHRL
jgi:hypothetical protein